MMNTIRKMRQRLLRNNRGGTAIEFSLAAPVLIFMISGVIEFGRAAYTQGALAFATEEATRYATVNYDATTDELKSVASKKIIGIRKDRISKVAVTETLNADQTKLVTVQINYDHHFLLPIFEVESLTLNGASKGFLVEK